MDDQQHLCVSTPVAPQDGEAPAAPSAVSTKRRHTSDSPPPDSSQPLRRRLQTSEAGNTYASILHSGGIAHYGDAYHSGPSQDERKLQVILESLRYDGMHDRRNALSEPAQGTFDWKFLDGKVDFVVGEMQEWHNTTESVDMSFRAWLKQDTGGLFCFMGKPGSGKSTLMKSLATSSELASLLSTWSKGASLRRGDHFIWLLGSPMQRTYDGILRDLLHSLLKTELQASVRNRLALMGTICGPRWTSSNASSAWSIEELKQTLSRVVSSPGIMTFFLIDALDECEPQDSVGDLAEEIRWISQLPNVKVCVSCRPWNVFTRTFRHAPTLRLDQLTYNDVQIYVESRLIKSEAELDLACDFREKTLAASTFIRKVASAAEGVFLWAVLVAKALGSEIRKGNNIAQLHSILADFPSDLDQFFRKTIYDRISSSPRNQSDTAAALKLCLQIVKREQAKSWDADTTESQSFMNFWLLGSKRLDRNFSWTRHDSKCYSQIDIERMVRQTAIFLEETCSDLLVLVDQRLYSHEYASLMHWDVHFVHRTVFDFLRIESNIKVIERHAPMHFSTQDFILDMAKLRCIHLLHDKSAGCGVLEYRFIAAAGYHLQQTPRDRQFLLACEDLLISHLRTSCRSLGLGHLFTEISLVCTTVGLSRYLIEALQVHPRLHTIENENDSLLADALRARSKEDPEGPDLALLHTLLDFGCDTNGFLSEQSPWQSGDAIFGPKTSWCELTPFMIWLAKAKIQAEMYRQPNESPERTPTTNEAFFQLQRRNYEVVVMLLEHGADPECDACITDHDSFNVDLDTCSDMSLKDILPFIVPAAQLAEVESLRARCSESARRLELRRNQRLRATQHLVDVKENMTLQTSISDLSCDEKKHLDDLWKDHVRLFVDCVMVEHMRRRRAFSERCAGLCGGRSERSSDKVLIFCIDCEKTCCVCTSCYGDWQELSFVREPCRCKVPSTSEHTLISYPAVKAEGVIGDYWKSLLSTLEQWLQTTKAGRCDCKTDGDQVN